MDQILIQENFVNGLMKSCTMHAVCLCLKFLIVAIRNRPIGGVKR